MNFDEMTLTRAEMEAFEGVSRWCMRKLCSLPDDPAPLEKLKAAVDDVIDMVEAGTLKVEDGK